MRFLLSLSLLLLVLLAGPGYLVPSLAQAPPAEPAHTAPDLAHLQPLIAGQTDSARVYQLREFGDRMMNAGRFDQAAAALADALAIGTAAANVGLMSKAEASLGYLASSQAQLSEAAQHYRRAYNLIKNTPDYSRQAKMLTRLATVFVDAKDWPNAERYLRQALALAQQHHLPAEEAAAYGLWSNLAGKRHRPPEAVAYNDKALAVYEAAADWPSYHSTLINQAICYKNAGQYALSARAFRRVMQYAQEQHDDFLLHYVYINFPNTLLLLHQPDEAERYALLGLAQLTNAPFGADRHKELYDALTRIKEQQGDYRQALAYHRLSAAYADTLLNAEKARQLTEAETRYQTRVKQAQIARLDEDNARQARQLLWLTLGAATLALLLLLTGWQYRTIRRTNAQLQATNQQVLDNNHRISEQSNRLTMLMKELHHRVKNNLAIVSGLLRLQANRLADTSAVTAVRESQQRVEAMAFIHQRLYQTADVTTVDMQPYVADLAQSLLAAYGHTPEAFDLTLDVASAPLEVDVAVPLGLILNELLTNALKYAYGQVARPWLRIYLGPGPAPTAEGLPDQPRTLLLEVHDNGPGIAPAQWGGTARSFGQRLIVSLSEQLGGAFHLSNQSGAYCRLLIPLVPTVEPPLE